MGENFDFHLVYNYAQYVRLNQFTFLMKNKEISFSSTEQMIDIREILRLRPKEMYPWAKGLG